jgi:gluconate 2-dehydrogenase gamma chain
MAGVDPIPGRPAGMSRRTALKLGVVGLVGVAAGAGSTALITRLGGVRPTVYRSFSETEAELLNDICEQIIPRDDVPGAADSGAVTYIDRQLGGPFARHRPTYRQGLASFGRTCLQVYGRSFHELTVADKIAALRSLEAGQAPEGLWDKPSPQAFFELVLAHTMQGFYGSPRHGGNRNYASYRMLGLDYPQVVGRNRVPPA